MYAKLSRSKIKKGNEFMSYSRVKRRALKKQKHKQVAFGLLFTGLTVGLTGQSVNTESFVKVYGEEKTSEALEITTLETSVPMTIEATKAVSTDAHVVAFAATNLIKSVNYQQESPTYSEVVDNATVGQTSYTTPVTYTVQNVSAPASYSGVLSNGNTAGAIGTEAAAQMAEATGVPQSTWEYIIARESNGNPNASNPSGASGLFQTMPGWGSTATVQDQVNTAIKAYKSQGLSAWGVQ